MGKGMLQLDGTLRGCRFHRRRRRRRRLRRRSPLSSSTCSPHEKSLWFRAFTSKGNVKWFAVHISNRDDDGGGGGEWRKKHKLKLSPISRKKCGLAGTLVCLDSTIYCLGGFHCAEKFYRNRPTNDVRCLDASSPSPRWKNLTSSSPMNVGRTLPCTVVVNGKLYVMGGNLVVNPTKDTEIDRWAEVFDPQSKNWSSLPEPPSDMLPFGSAVLSCVALEDLQKILVTKYNSDEAYVFDISRNIWTKHSVNLGIRFSSRVLNKDTAVCGHTLYWYDKHISRLHVFDWESGKSFSGKVRGFERAARKIKDGHCGGPIDTYLFHLADKVFCMVWEKGPTVHCYKFVVDLDESCNGSLCAWVLSSQAYYLGPNPTLSGCALMNGGCVLDSAGKARSHQEPEPTTAEKTMDFVSY